jgi:simple sugar transport system permease protein
MTAYTERAKASPLVEWLNDHAQVLSIALFFAVCMACFRRKVGHLPDRRATC